MERIIDAWHAALARPIHGGMCRCCIPAGVVLDEGVLEESIIDHLIEKNDGEVPSLCSILHDRRTVKQGSFLVWLQAGTTSDACSIHYDRMLEYILAVLESIGCA